MPNIFKNKQQRTAESQIKKKKKIIAERKLDTALVRTAATGGKILSGQAGRLATLQAEKGQPIRRNMSGARVDNAGTIGGSGGVGRKFR